MSAAKQTTWPETLARIAELRREYQRMSDLWEEAKEIKEVKTVVDAAETTKEVGEAASDL